MNTNCYTQHPISIIQGIGKSFFLLIFPTIRTLLALRFDVYTWISGAWFDILIIMAILSYAYFKYRSKYIITENRKLIFSSGILFKRKSVLNTDRITTVYFSNNPFYKLFGAVRVIIETNGGLSHSPEFYITLSRKQASRLSGIFISSKVVRVKKNYKPELHFLIFYSIQSTSTLSGILLLSALFSQGGAILGRQLRNEFLNTVSDLSRRIFLGIPPIATTISIILLTCWGVGFLFNVIRYMKFHITKKDEMLIIDKGIFVRQKYYVNSSKIISISRKQSLLTKALGISSVFLNCAGYGKGKGESSVIFPAVNNSESDRTLKMILPEFHFCKIKMRPKRNALFSYISFPLFLCGINVIMLTFVIKSDSNLTELIRFALIITLIPCVWFTIVRAVSSRLCGVGISGEFVTINYVKGFSFRKVCCKKSHITKAQIKQNPLSKITGKCRLIIFCAGERGKKLTILGLYKSQAENAIKKVV